MTRERFTWPALVALVLCAAGCSWFGDDRPEYFDAEPSKPLEIPEGLDRPDTSTALTIAGQSPRAPETAELEPRPPRVIAATGGDADDQSQIGWTADGPYLYIEDSPESVARRMRFAIERSGMRLQQTAADGAHEFDYRHQPIDDEGFFESLLFWRDGVPNFSGQYRLKLVPADDGTRMFVVGADGAPADPQAAEHLLVIFGERLG